MNSVVSIPLYEKTARGTACRLSPFLAGKENALIGSAVHEILSDTQETFPVFFCAPFGFGKSHLATGTFQTWLFLHPQGTGKRISARDFVKQWNVFLNTQTVAEFYRVYEPLDILVMEDLHEIEFSDAVGNVLAELLDKLHGRGAKTLFTSATPLSGLRLSAPLASRLRGGVSLSIRPPALETRLAILQLEEHCRNMKWTPDAVEYLAECSAQVENSVYEMLNIKRQLDMNRRANRASYVTVGDVRLFFDQKAEECSLSIADIAKRTAKYCKVRLSDLRGTSRKASLVLARDIVYYLTRKLTSFTLAEVGAYFGGRDHTTVLHGCQKTEERLKTDSDVRYTVESLFAELRPLTAPPVKK